MNRNASFRQLFYAFVIGVTLTSYPGCLWAFVQSDNCDNLDLHAITRLLTIELDIPWQLAKNTDGLGVTLDCDSDKNNVTIEIWDPITEKKVQRTLHHISADGAERVIALVISQLFKASWSELLIVQTATPPSNASEGNIAVAEAVAEKTFRHAPREWMASIGAGYRRRHLTRGVNAFHSLLSIGRRFKNRWIPGGYIGFDMGEHDVAMGAVRFVNIAAGAEGVLRFAPTSRLAIDLGTAVGASWSYLLGKVDVPALQHSTTAGFSLESMLFIGPGLRTNDLLLRLQLEGGYAISNPTAGVGNGESFTLGGAFLGVSLRIFYAFSKRKK